MRPRERYLLFALLFLSPLLGCSSSRDAVGIPRDSSFTVQTAAAKVVKEYPEASAVIPVLPENVVRRSDVVYATIGARRLHLDIFEPAAAPEKCPAVLFIHGGGWSSGDPSMETPLAQNLAAKGYVTATVEYRLSPEARYPAAVQDLKSAVRWLRAHASTCHVDSARIGLCGGSSGGHLAALLGATNGDRTFDTGENLEYSSAVQAVVDIDGPLDLTSPEESGKDENPLKPSAGKRWIGYSLKERPDLWREASPLFHAGSGNPPIAFINSSIDRFHVGRDEMIRILSSAGIHAEVHRIPKSPHPFWLFHPWFQETMAHVQAFFDRFLKK